MAKYFLVAHTHWDREWHKTYEENRVRLIPFMRHLLSELEQDEDITCFMLDGQTSLLLDYLEICPEEEERLKRYVQARRLLIGPWIVQPDVNIPSGEALIRNLLLSKKISDHFGEFMSLGYLPDSFGMCADLPTILQSFGIKDALFYRGLSADEVSQDIFWWEGYDESRVLAGWMPDGYGNAMFMNNELKHNKAELQKISDKRKERSVDEHYLLMSGSDQCFAKTYLGKAARELQKDAIARNEDVEIYLTSPVTYFESLRETGDVKEVFKGEMRHGRHSRTHSSIAATRMDIKQENYIADIEYRYQLEPLCSVASVWGIEYPGECINRGWRYLLENHAHDSICCCCTDEVHKEMRQRIASARQIGRTLYSDTLEAMHQKIRYEDGLGRPLLIFSSFAAKRRVMTQATVYAKANNFALTNRKGKETPYVILSERAYNLKDSQVSLVPLPDDFYREVNILFYAETNGVGYTTYYVKEDIENKVTETNLSVTNNCLENNHIRVEIQEDGSLLLEDKDQGIIYKGQHIFRDGGNAGDEYDYSPPPNDHIYTSKNQSCKMSVVEDTLLRGCVEVEYILYVPDTTDAMKRSDNLIPLPIVVKISLGCEDHFLDFETKIQNQAKNHRLQVVFDLGAVIDTHIANVQLGEITRENVSPFTQKSYEQNWSERCHAVYTQQGHMALERNDGNGLLLMSRGLPQYEILQEDTTQAALTLLSSVGRMGNENLVYRPGRRSGAICDTPDAQMEGEFKTSYRLQCVNKSISKTTAAGQYHSPIVTRAYALYTTTGVMPDESYPLKQEGELLLQAYKEAEDGSGLIARFVNPTQYPLFEQKILSTPEMFKYYEEVNTAEALMEEKKGQAIWSNNSDGSNLPHFSGIIKVDLAAHAIYTVKYIS